MEEEEKRLLSYWQVIIGRLFTARIVFLSGQIVTTSQGMPYPGGADNIIAQLLSLEAEDPAKSIKLYINSPGGEASAALAIYDTMQSIKCPVHTIAVGMAASGAALILAGGEKGKRYALPNARIMIHQPLVPPPVGVTGQAIDIKIEAEEIMRLRGQINQILAAHTGQTVKKIERDTDRNFWMSPEEAKEYGIIDRVIAPRQ